MVKDFPPSPIFRSALFRRGSLLILLCVLIGVSFFFRSVEAFPPPPVISLEGANIELEKVSWSEYLKRVGPERAYESFKEIYKVSVYPIRHSMMHVLGDVLYENLGIEGFAVCDDAFGYGCYHQLYIAAFEREGSDVLPRFAELCLSKSGREQSFCVQGIGHGALEANVNSEDGLRKAIAACDSISGVLRNSLPVCLEGVFMQYYNPDRESETARPFDPVHPSRICDIVPEKFRFHCYLSIARWWLSASNHDYKLAGRLCAQVPVSFQPPCYRGIGVEVLTWSGFDLNGATKVEETLKVCSSIEGKKGSEYCRIGAAATARLFEWEQAAVDALCRDLFNEELAECIQ